MVKTDKGYLRLSIKPLKLLQGVAGLVATALGGSPDKGIKGVADCLEAVKGGDDATKTLTELITTSLSGVLASLLKQQAPDLNLDTARMGRFVVHGASDREIEVKLPADFLKRPQSHEAITDLSPALISWLLQVGVSDIDATNIVARLPSLLSRALMDEWQRRPSHYSRALPALENPFEGASRFDLEATAYSRHLATIPDEPVFDESFSLRQIFVPLRCSWEASNSPLSHSEEYDPNIRKHHELGWLNDETDNWFHHGSDTRPVCLISGGPGSGKSSFAKMFVSALSHCTQIIAVPLHLLDMSASVERAVDDYLVSTEHFTEPPLDELIRRGKTLLVFDGLDELQLRGKIAQEASQAFVADLLRFLQTKNEKRKRVVALITGRDVAVQSSEAALKSSGHFIHVAPYAFPERYTYEVNTDSELYGLDQRDEWWTRYASLVGANFSEMPKELREGELNEVTIQPLLNYLVALAIRQGLRVDEATNINTVYAYLLNAVFKRSWEKSPHPSLSNVTFESFVRLLEEVAVSVWHGAGRTTTLKEVEAHCRKSGVAKLIPSLEEGAAEGVSKLLLAFYFRQKGVGAEGDKTFEFTHKSFAEYLISLRIVRLIVQVNNRRRENVGDPEEGWDLQTALVKWVEVMGAAPLDAYMMAFLRREVASHETSEVSQWQGVLTEMLNSTLKHRLPMHRIPFSTFREAAAHDRNAEEAIFVCVNACARKTERLVEVVQPSPSALGETIKRLQGQRASALTSPVLQSLSHFRFDGAIVHMADFYSADLRNSSFKGAELAYTIMVHCDVRGCDFRGANFFQTLLFTLDMQGARFDMPRESTFILEDLFDSEAGGAKAADFLTRHGATIGS